MILMGLHPDTIYPYYATVSTKCCLGTPMKLRKVGGKGTVFKSDFLKWFSVTGYSLYEECREAGMEGRGRCQHTIVSQHATVPLTYGR